METGRPDNDSQEIELENLSFEFDRIVDDCSKELQAASTTRNEEGPGSASFQQAVGNYRDCLTRRDRRLEIVRKDCQAGLDKLNDCVAKVSQGTRLGACTEYMRGFVVCAKAALKEHTQ